MSTRSIRKRVCRVPDLRDSFEGIVAGKIFAQLGRATKGQERQLLGTENEPEQLGIEGNDSRSDDPGDDLGEARVGELAHLLTITGELDERDHRKWQLETENHLAEDEQRGNLVLASDADNESGRNDGDAARDEPPQPRLEANVEKTFHHDLPGKRAGERGILPGGEQGAGEERARKACAEDGTKKFVGVGNLSDVVEAARVKCGSAQDEDGGVDKKCEAESERGIEDGITQSFLAITNGSAERARLDDARVQIEIVRHHGGAQDADGDVQHLLIAQDFRAWNETGDGFAP